MGFYEVKEAQKKSFNPVNVLLNYSQASINVDGVMLGKWSYCASQNSWDYFRKLWRQINVQRVLLESLLRRFMCDKLQSTLFLNLVFLFVFCFIFLYFNRKVIKATSLRDFCLHVATHECLQRDHRRLEGNNLTTLRETRSPTFIHLNYW